MTKKELNYIKNLINLSIESEEDSNILLHNLKVSVKKGLIGYEESNSEILEDLNDNIKARDAIIKRLNQEKEAYIKKGTELLEENQKLKIELDKKPINNLSTGEYNDELIDAIYNEINYECGNCKSKECIKDDCPLYRILQLIDPHELPNNEPEDVIIEE